MTDLEHWYHITGNGKLTMRDRTPTECPEFRANLRRLMRARMNKQRGQNYERKADFIQWRYGAGDS